MLVLGCVRLNFSVWLTSHGSKYWMKNLLAPNAVETTCHLSEIYDEEASATLSGVR